MRASWKTRPRSDWAPRCGQGLVHLGSFVRFVPGAWRFLDAPLQLADNEAMRVLTIALLMGCGASQTSVAETPRAPEEPPAEEVVTYEPPVTAGMIERGQLVAVLDAGLGRFLQGVDTEPHLADGGFIGFRLRRLYPADDRFSRLDLKPGDTVTAVNGQSIERPEQALQVWESLRVASELMVEYLREDETRTLRFEIVD